MNVLKVVTSTVGQLGKLGHMARTETLYTEVLTLVVR